jgi:hypothetical protein
MKISSTYLKYYSFVIFIDINKNIVNSRISHLGHDEHIFALQFPGLEEFLQHIADFRLVGVGCCRVNVAIAVAERNSQSLGHGTFGCLKTTRMIKQWNLIDSKRQQRQPTCQVPSPRMGICTPLERLMFGEVILLGDLEVIGFGFE